MLLVLCTPALAQNPSASQYETRAEFCPTGPASVQPSSAGNEAQVQSIGDGACAAAENAGQGTDAVNDALNETPASTSSSASGDTSIPSTNTPASDEASASPESAAPGNSEDTSVPTGDAETENAEAGDAGDGLASITELPETGGAPLPVLVAGVLLVAGGLCALRMFR